MFRYFSMSMAALLIYATAISSLHAEYTVSIVTEENNIRAIIPFITQQRLKAFREYPYLYEGNTKEEYEYLSWLAGQPHTAIAIAYQDNMPVACVEGTGFVDFDSHFAGSVEIFEKAGLQSKRYYYLSEAVTSDQHPAVCFLLFKALESFAKQRGFSAGCLVYEYNTDHPLQPKNYQNRDTLFNALGYHKTDLSLLFAWDTVQVDESRIKQDHTLTYWIKDFCS